jgi:hypothetical protein
VERGAVEVVVVVVGVVEVVEDVDDVIVVGLWKLVDNAVVGV